MKKTAGILALAGLVSFVTFINISAKGKKPIESVKVGQSAPNFTLPDPEGKTHSLADYKGKYVVLEWTNYGCPYVQKHYDTGNMQGLQAKAKDMGVVWLSICSSSKGKQGYMNNVDWKKSISDKGTVSQAVLLDPEGKVGRLYGAKTTPHMFIVDPDGNVSYQGAIDDKPTAYKEDVVGAKNFVMAALQESIGGKPVSVSQTKAYGCSVKY